jgi:transposase-like protein
MIKLRQQGLSLRAIQEKLAARGIDIHHTTVRKVLDNAGVEAPA